MLADLALEQCLQSISGAVIPSNRTCFVRTCAPAEAPLAFPPLTARTSLFALFLSRYFVAIHVEVGNLNAFAYAQPDIRFKPHLFGDERHTGQKPYLVIDVAEPLEIERARTERIGMPCASEPALVPMCRVDDNARTILGPPRTRTDERRDDACNRATVFLGRTAKRRQFLCHHGSVLLGELVLFAPVSDRFLQTSSLDAVELRLHLHCDVSRPFAEFI